MKKQFLVALTALSLLAACKKEESNETPTPTEATLYTRLGGIDAITAVTDQFIANVAADSVINKDFAATVADPQRFAMFRQNLIDQIAAGTGGPYTYKGKTMLEAHKGMGITDAEFNALVGDLVMALDKFKVPEKEKNELLGILGPMRSDIVGK